MKNSIMVVMSIVFVGLMQNSMAQIWVYPVFNSITSGRSINILASAQVKNRHEFGGGLRININKYIHNDDQHKIYFKRMFATKPLHYFGVEGFYHIHLLQKLQHIDFFAFYDIQLVYSTTGNRFESYVFNMAHFGPFTWIEQNIGIGFTVDIWKNFFLIQRLGGGAHFILGYDKPFSDTKNDYLIKKLFEWEFGYLLNVGIGYRFNPKKKSK